MRAKFMSERGTRRSFGGRKGPCPRVHVASKGTALLRSRVNATPGGRGLDLVWWCDVGGALGAQRRLRRSERVACARHPEGAQHVAFKWEAFGNQ